MVVGGGSGEYGQAMGEQAGRSISAIGEQQAALSTRHAANADADRALSEALAGAHAATVEGVRRLDAIAAEIDSAVTNQAALALDTAMGAREFRKFLIAKEREIAAVVSEASEVASAKAAVLHELRGHYTGPAV
jgi:predicted component of type VI protein secretion system